MMILELQNKVTDFFKTMDNRFKRSRSPSLNIITMVLLIYKYGDCSYLELEQYMQKSKSGIKRLIYALMEKSDDGRTGYGFIEVAWYDVTFVGPHRTIVKLTPLGEQFAKLIAPYFGL